MLDENDEDIGPVYNKNYIMTLYVMIFILVGHYFFVNLFTGAIFLNFIKAH